MQQKQTEETIRKDIIAQVPRLIENTLQQLGHSMQSAVTMATASSVCRRWLLRADLLLEHTCKLFLALQPLSNPDCPEQHALLHSRGKQLKAYRNHRSDWMLPLIMKKEALSALPQSISHVLRYIRTDVSFGTFDLNGFQTRDWLLQLRQACKENRLDHLADLIQEAYAATSDAVEVWQKILLQAAHELSAKD